MPGLAEHGLLERLIETEAGNLRTERDVLQAEGPFILQVDDLILEFQHLVLSADTSGADHGDHGHQRDEPLH